MLVTLDVFEVFHADCFVDDPDYTYKLYGATLLPLGLTVLVLGVSRVVVAVTGGHVLRGTGVKWLLVVLYFTLTTTSTIVCQTFACNEFERGDGTTDSFMSVDMVIECQGTRYESIIAYATAMFFVFPLGVPLLVGVLLWTRRRDIASRETIGGDESLASLRLLFQAYLPAAWPFAIGDMYRRLSLTSLLMFFSPVYQSAIALFVALVSIVLTREVAPFVEPGMESVNQSCGWLSTLAVIALIFGLLSRLGPGYSVDDSALSAALCAASVLVVGFIVHSTDRARRSRDADMLKIFFETLETQDKDDKRGFDDAYATYVAKAPKGAEARLLRKLAELAESTPKTPVRQPDELKTVEALVAASNEYNDTVHETLRRMVEACGGEYHAGPPKLGARIKQKADADYNGDASQVIDTLRGSGMYHSLEGYTRAVEALLGDSGEGGGGGKPLMHSIQQQAMIKRKQTFMKMKSRTSSM